MASAYETLGVSATAVPEEIESAFNALRGRYPVEQSASSRAEALQVARLEHAYRLLREPDARARHDRELIERNAALVSRRKQTFDAPDEVPFLKKPWFIILTVGLVLLATGFGMKLQRDSANEKRALEAEIARRAEADAAAKEDMRLAMIQQAREARDRKAEEDERRLRRMGPTVTVEVERTGRVTRYDVSTSRDSNAAAQYRRVERPEYVDPAQRAALDRQRAAMCARNPQFAEC